MISPQKFSKSIGNSQLKVGLTVKELIACSFVPFTADLLGFEPMYGALVLLGLITLCILRNKFLEKSFFENSLTRKSHFEWEKVNIK